MTDAILLAEDNRFDAKVFRHAMHDGGIELPIMVAKDGIEALAILRQQHAALDMLVVTDVKMPRMDGIELLRQIRKTAEIADMPVFVVTTSELSSDRDEAQLLGIEGYVRKSGDERELIEPIVAYLTKREDLTI